MCATAVDDKELLQVAVVDEGDTLLMQVSSTGEGPFTESETVCGLWLQCWYIMPVLL
jgi:hypothetical protein